MLGFKDDVWASQSGGDPIAELAWHPAAIDFARALVPAGDMPALVASGTSKMDAAEARAVACGAEPRDTWAVRLVAPNHMEAAALRLAGLDAAGRFVGFEVHKVIRSVIDHRARVTYAADDPERVGMAARVVDETRSMATDLLAFIRATGAAPTPAPLAVSATYDEAILGIPGVYVPL